MTLDDFLKACRDYGVLGLMVMGFLSGLIVPKWVHGREVKRADEATDLIRSQQDTIDRLARGLRP